MKSVNFNMNIVTFVLLVVVLVLVIMCCMKTNNENFQVMDTTCLKKCEKKCIDNPTCPTWCDAGMKINGIKYKRGSDEAKTERCKRQPRKCGECNYCQNMKKKIIR